MTRYASTGERWDDDPARGVVTQLFDELSAELGTDGPPETFGHPEEHRVGHLVEDDHGVGVHDDHDYLATDTGDLEDLSAEELAMHFVDEEEDAEDELDPTTRADLGDF